MIKKILLGVWRKGNPPTLLTHYGANFPGGSDGKASAYNVGDPGLIPGLGRSPGEGNGDPLPYSCLENQHEQRSQRGYSPWGRRESHMHVCTHKIYCKKYWRSMQI